MESKRKSTKGRLLLTGIILFILLGIGVFITSRIINRTASTMSDRIIAQIGEYHYNLLEQEFFKATQIMDVFCHLTEQQQASALDGMEMFTTTINYLDPNINSIWIEDTTGKRHTYLLQQYQQTPTVLSSTAEWSQKFLIDTLHNNSWSRIISQNGIPSWQLVRLIKDSNGISVLCGIDYSLLKLHDYIAERNPNVRSYATIFTSDGTIVYYPDSRLLGKNVANKPWMNVIRQVLSSGQDIKTTSMSEYLGIEVVRLYYPFNIAGSQWVISINIPHLAIEQEMRDFHIYTLLTAAISIVLFTVLLFVAQFRWRREYELRRHAERESQQLHLQQVIDQINPHFLFNSLNSLYVLINHKPALAREFTITLARVYRHVLEHRKEILSTVANEINFTRQYYFLLQIRFENRIKLSIDIDPKVELLRIPSMSLQTLVENAIKHNIVTNDNPLQIRVYTIGERLIIENNYTPKEKNASDSMGVGLERIRSIYRFYTAENIEVSIANGCFRCTLPLLPAEK